MIGTQHAARDEHLMFCTWLAHMLHMIGTQHAPHDEHLMFCTWLHPNHLSVRIGDSLRHSVQIVRNLDCTFQWDHYILAYMYQNQESRQSDRECDFVCAYPQQKHHQCQSCLQLPQLTIHWLGTWSICHLKHRWNCVLLTLHTKIRYNWPGAFIHTLPTSYTQTPC